MPEDRYTRLKAIKEFGYDIDWEELSSYHVGIIGIGGLGCVSSEMATRCGIGKLSLFDFDTVEIVNLNRSMYKPEHVGKFKVEVAYKVLKNVNPDVEIFYFKKDIMNPDFESTFEMEISKLDIILNGLDNIPAREYLNSKCIRLNIPYIDAGASRSGLSGYVQPIVPGKTPCAKCIKSFSVNLPDERGEPCVASLPSTMAILASIQIQEMLKFLLKFGKMIGYLVYDMISGQFFNYSTQKDENCTICGSVEVNDSAKMDKNISKKDLDNLITKLKQ